MKRTICVVLVALMLVGGVAAADDYRYPGGVYTGIPWEETLVDGYRVGVEVWVWEPVRASQDYAHPANSLADTNYMVRGYPGYNGEIAWVIPFAVRTTNLTVGFGGLSHKLSVGVLKDIWTVKPRAETEDVTIVNMGYRDEHDARDDESAYFLPILCTGTGKEKFTDMITKIGGEEIDIVVFRDRIEKYRVDEPANRTITLEEGDSKFTLGWFVFVDRKKTPNSPQGLTAEELEWAIVAVGVRPRENISSYIEAKKIVGMTKNEDDEIVVDRKYNVF